MIYLSEETSSQENMEAWFSQLSDPEFPLVKDSVLKLLKPRLVTKIRRVCLYRRRLAAEPGKRASRRHYGNKL